MNLLREYRVGLLSFLRWTVPAHREFRAMIAFASSCGWTTAINLVLENAAKTSRQSALAEKHWLRCLQNRRQLYAKWWNCKKKILRYLIPLHPLPLPTVSQAWGKIVPVEMATLK